MTKVRATENEFRSQVISWLNTFLSQGGYHFELATGDPSLATIGGRRFPDVQLWINREAGEGFCGWELKTPVTQADDPQLIKNAIEKAGHMHAHYFVTWNMRDAILWEMVDAGSQKVQRLLTYPSLSVASVEELAIPTQRIILENQARAILDDLSRLYHEGHLTYVGADDWFFIKRLTETSEKIYPHFKKRIFDLAARNADFRHKLQEWAAKQGFIIGEQEAFFTTIARQIVYQLLGRILFFEVLRRFKPEIGSINIANLSEDKANELLKEKFAEIRAIDYQAIFEEDLPDKIAVPEGALPELVKLIDDFGRRDFAHLPQEVLGSVFENLIPPEERHRLGQYFTKEDLVDFITAFCVGTKDAVILDPTCGTGTFLIRAYDRLKWNFAERNHQKLLSQIWGVDIAPFPAELATINLYRQDISEIGNFPRILKKDFFLIEEGQTYEFPPNRPFADYPTRKINEPLPKFDAVIGNPPYIRQEDIDKVAQNYTTNTVLPTLAKDKAILAPNIEIMGEQVDPVQLSGQADIYASMFVHASALLKEGGRLGFVTSNSWLGAEYGRELQKFFLRHFKIVAIVESRVEPWFETAQVNTIFTILELCENKEERDNHLAKFVSVKKKLKDIIPWDMRLEAADRWHNLDLIIQKIEHAGNKFINIERNGKIVVSPPNLINDFEDENLRFRVRVIKQGELEEGVSRAFGAGHWGRFLRAPKIYFDLRQTLAEKLVSLSDESITETRRGITGGITDFFTLTSERAKEFGIEKEFLAPFLTTFRDVEKPVIDPKDTGKLLFYCHLDKNELRCQGKKGALKYIEWGETQTTTGRGQVGRAGVPWPEVPSVKNRPRWYDVGEREPGDIIINRFIGERIFFPLNLQKIFVSDTFFEASFVDKELRDIWTALMNSSLVYLFAEIAGRTEAGGGVLRLYGPEIKTLFLPDARKITPASQKKILSTFAPLLKRRIKKVSEEVKEKDRQEFDAAVLEALGLEPQKYLNAIYQGLVELVEARVKLGKMQQVEKKSRKTSDIPKIKQEVLKEVLPDGLIPFPEGFISPRALKKEVTVPAGKLTLGEYFMGRQQIVNEQGEKYEASSQNEAEFIVFSQKPHTHIIRLPASSVEITQSLQKYRRYLKELREKLMRAFILRTGDERLSERLTAETMQELGILI